MRPATNEENLQWQDGWHRAHSESTAFTSRSTPSSEMSGSMKNCAKRSRASSRASQLHSKW